MKYQRTWRFWGYWNDNYICGFWWVGWDCFSLGISICLLGNIEIHLPFGFLVFGRRLDYSLASFAVDGRSLRFQGKQE